QALGADKVSLQASELIRNLLASCDPVRQIPEPTNRAEREAPPAEPRDNSKPGRASQPTQRRAALVAISAAGALALAVGTLILFDSGVLSDKATTSVVENRQLTPPPSTSLPNVGDAGTAVANQPVPPPTREKLEAVPDVAGVPVPSEPKIV